MDRLHAALVFLSMIATTILGMLAFADGARADQCAWVDKAAADRAKKLLDDAKELQEICRPCGEKTARPLAIDHVDVEPASDPKYFEVKVNGRALDVAYVYVKMKDGKWTNVGLLARCGADVTAVKLVLGKEDFAATPPPPKKTK